MAAKSHRRVRVAASLVILGLALFTVVLRCDQLANRAEDSTRAAVAQLSHALQSGTSLDGARRRFEAAARHSVTDPYPLFCLSALDDLEGSGQSDALVALRSYRLDAAEAALRTEREALTDTRRVDLYLRLVDDLRRYADE